MVVDVHIRFELYPSENKKGKDRTSIVLLYDVVVSICKIIFLHCVIFQRTIHHFRLRACVPEMYIVNLLRYNLSSGL